MTIIYAKQDIHSKDNDVKTAIVATDYTTGSVPKNLSYNASALNDDNANTTIDITAKPIKSSARLEERASNINNKSIGTNSSTTPQVTNTGDDVPDLIASATSATINATGGSDMTNNMRNDCSTIIANAPSNGAANIANTAVTLTDNNVTNANTTIAIIHPNIQHAITGANSNNASTTKTKTPTVPTAAAPPGGKDGGEPAANNKFNVGNNIVVNNESNFSNEIIKLSIELSIKDTLKKTGRNIIETLARQGQIAQYDIRDDKLYVHVRKQTHITSASLDNPFDCSDDIKRNLSACSTFNELVKNPYAAYLAKFYLPIIATEYYAKHSEHLKYSCVASINGMRWQLYCIAPVFVLKGNYDLDRNVSANAINNITDSIVAIPNPITNILSSLGITAPAKCSSEQIAQLEAVISNKLHTENFTCANTGSIASKQYIYQRPIIPCSMLKTIFYSGYPMRLAQISVHGVDYSKDPQYVQTLVKYFMYYPSISKSYIDLLDKRYVCTNIIDEDQAHTRMRTRNVYIEEQKTHAPLTGISCSHTPLSAACLTEIAANYNIAVGSTPTQSNISRFMGVVKDLFQEQPNIRYTARDKIDISSGDTTKIVRFGTENANNLFDMNKDGMFVAPVACYIVCAKRCPITFVIKPNMTIDRPIAHGWQFYKNLNTGAEVKVYTLINKKFPVSAKIALTSLIKTPKSEFLTAQLLKENWQSVLLPKCSMTISNGKSGSISIRTTFNEAIGLLKSLYDLRVLDQKLQKCESDIATHQHSELLLVSQKQKQTLHKERQAKYDARNEGAKAHIVYLNLSNDWHLIHQHELDHCISGSICAMVGTKAIDAEANQGENAIIKNDDAQNMPHIFRGANIFIRSMLRKTNVDDQVFINNAEIFAAYSPQGNWHAYTTTDGEYIKFIGAALEPRFVKAGVLNRSFILNHVIDTQDIIQLPFTASIYVGVITDLGCVLLTDSTIQLQYDILLSVNLAIVADFQGNMFYIAISLNKHNPIDFTITLGMIPRAHAATQLQAQRALAIRNG
jgi:hypothetical protein